VGIYGLCVSVATRERIVERKFVDGRRRIEDLQQRVRRALGALGRTGCDEASPIPNSPLNIKSNPHTPAYMRARE